MTVPSAWIATPPARGRTSDGASRLGGPVTAALGDGDPGDVRPVPVDLDCEFVVDDEDANVEVVVPRPNREAGPFWEPDQLISDDFDELHRWLGISRQTYDEAMAWSELWDFRGYRRHPNYEQERQRLMERLRRKAKEGITFI